MVYSENIHSSNIQAEQIVLMYLRLCVIAVNKRCYELEKKSKEVTYEGLVGGKGTKNDILYYNLKIK